MTKKWIITLGILLSLGFCNQVVMAQNIFGNSDFFKMKKPAPKVEPQILPKTQPIIPVPKIPTLLPNVPNSESQETNLISLNTFTSYECSAWWQIALGLALLFAVFIVLAKKRPHYFKQLNNISLLIIWTIIGILAWQLHHFIHYDWKHYDNAFLCYNYWVIIGFELFYFLTLYVLLFSTKKTKTRGKIKIAKSYRR